MKKRILSVILTVCIAVSLIPTVVFAENEEPSVTITALDGTQGFKNENYENLFDGDSNTKWCAKSTNAFFVFKTSELSNIVTYTFTTCSDTSYDQIWKRNPTDWAFYGCNDYNEYTNSGGTWELIEAVTDNHSLPNNRDCYPVDFTFTENNKYYQYYRLLITGNDGDECLQLSEVKLNAVPCKHVWEGAKTTEPTCREPKYSVRRCIGACKTEIKTPIGDSLGHTPDGNNRCTRCGNLLEETIYDLLITGGSLGLDYKYEGGILNIYTETPLRIANTSPEKPNKKLALCVKSTKGANLTFAGVNIDTSKMKNACAFNIDSSVSGNVNISLEKDTTNIFKSGENCAGIQNSSANCQLSLEGSATLLAYGGKYAAAIGGGFKGSTGDIKMNVAYIKVQGGDNGAGIGSGKDGTAGNITILRGTVKAGGGGNAAAIGSGRGGTVENITVLTGIVTAIGGGNAAGIGGGADGMFKKLTVNSGHINSSGGDNACGIGNGVNSENKPVPSVVFNGGSIKSSIAVTPVNSANEPLYLLQIPNRYLNAVYVDGKPLSVTTHQHLSSEDERKIEHEHCLYAYLTGNTHTVKASGLETHTHFENNTLSLAVPSDEFGIDEDSHWFNCETEGCDLRIMSEQHSGGNEATCTSPTYCDYCNKPYIAINPNNHTGKKEVTTTDASYHTQTWTCCGNVEKTTHTFNADACSVCKYTAKAAVTFNGVSTGFNTLAEAYEAMPESGSVLHIFGDCSDENVNFSSNITGFFCINKSCSVILSESAKLSLLYCDYNSTSIKPNVSITNNGYIQTVNVYPESNLVLNSGTGRYGSIVGFGVSVSGFLAEKCAYQDSDGNIINPENSTRVSTFSVAPHSTHTFQDGVCACGDKGENNKIVFSTSNGSTIADKTSVKLTDKILDGVQTPVRTGYDFAAWVCEDKTLTADTTYKDIVDNNNIKSITVYAKWICLADTVQKITDGMADPDVVTVKLTDDISCDGKIELSGVKTLDLNGCVLDVQIKMYDTTLTLIDSRPDNPHSDTSVPQGGVIKGQIEMTQPSDGTYPDCTLIANGGKVTGTVAMNSSVTKIKSTGTAHTSFLADVGNHGTVYGGVYYGNLKCKTEGMTVTFMVGKKFSEYVDGEHKLYIKDEKKKAVEVIQSDEKPYEPFVPAKVGYNGIGAWYTDTVLTDYWDFEQKTITEDITLYTYALPIWYTICFFEESHQEPYMEESYFYDEATELPEPDIYVKGYTFLGWNTKPDGTGTTYREKEPILNLSSTQGSSVNLYAIWKPNYATVSGKIKSFGDENEAVTLVFTETDSSTPSHTVTVCSKDGTYSIPNVIQRDFTVKVIKKDHVTREYDIDIDSENVVLNFEIFLKGDINTDGSIDVLDVAIAEKICNNHLVAKDYAFSLADINEDGAIDVNDYSAILNLALDT